MKKSVTSNFKRDINFRFNIIGLITIVFFVTILFRLINVIVINKKTYSLELQKLTDRIIEVGNPPRGRIYDRNYNILVDNKSVPIIVYKRQDGIKRQDEIKLAYTISNKVDLDYSLVSDRNLKDFIIENNPSYSDSLISASEWKKHKNRELSNNDIYYLKLNRITDEILDKMSINDKKAAYIYYLMNNNYSYVNKIIKKDNVSDEEVAYIIENANLLKGFSISNDWRREYLYGDTFRSILGNISNIKKEDKNYYLEQGYELDDIVGISYLEKQYESVLKGKKATYKFLSNDNIILNSEEKRGNDIVLTIDIKLQLEIEKILEEEIIKTKKEPSTDLFNHIYLVIQDPNNGEILAISGKEMLYVNGEYSKIDITPQVLTNPLTPGSVVKGASMLVGYNNMAVNIGEYQKDECIKLYSKPPKCSWKSLGNIDDITAMKNSSNVYQFKIAMKIANFDYSYNAAFNNTGDAFKIYRNTFNQFGLGVKTGIDLPIESIGNVGQDTSADLLLNFAIGQYDTYTTMQLSQYVTTIAANGNRYQPHLLKKVHEFSLNNDIGNVIYEFRPIVLNKVETDIKYLNRVQEEFREVMISGLGKNFMGNSPNPAGKTGTSESFVDTDSDGKIDTPTLSNAFVGYAPYDNPVMSIAITFPNLVNQNSDSNRSYAQSRITRRISEKFFEIYNK